MASEAHLCLLGMIQWETAARTQDTSHDGALVLAKFLTCLNKSSSYLPSHSCGRGYHDSRTWSRNRVCWLGHGFGCQASVLDRFTQALNCKKNTEKNVLAGSISRPQVTVREFDWFAIMLKTEGSSCDLQLPSLWSVKSLQC